MIYSRIGCKTDRILAFLSNEQKAAMLSGGKTTKQVAYELNVSYTTASRLIKQFQKEHSQNDH